MYIELSRHTNPVPALGSYRGEKEQGTEVEKKELLAGEVKSVFKPGGVVVVARYRRQG